MKHSLFLLGITLSMLTSIVHAMDRDENTLLVTSDNDIYVELVSIEKDNNDTTVQDTNTRTGYGDEFLNKRKSNVKTGAVAGAIIGVISGLGGLFGCMTTSCLFVIPAPAPIFLFLFGTPIVTALTGAAIGAGSTYCSTKPEERYTKTILKQIATYPPIIEKKGTI